MAKRHTYEIHGDKLCVINEHETFSTKGEEVLHAILFWWDPCYSHFCCLAFFFSVNKCCFSLFITRHIYILLVFFLVRIFFHKGILIHH